MSSLARIFAALAIAIFLGVLLVADADARGRTGVFGWAGSKATVRGAITWEAANLSGGRRSWNFRGYSK